MRQIDIFLQYPITFDDLKSRADRIVRQDTSFLVSSKDDLIVAKRAVNPMRTQDSRDIEDLQAIINRERP